MIAVVGDVLAPRLLPLQLPLHLEDVLLRELIGTVDSVLGQHRHRLPLVLHLRPRSCVLVFILHNTADYVDIILNWSQQVVIEDLVSSLPNSSPQLHSDSLLSVSLNSLETLEYNIFILSSGVQKGRRSVYTERRSLASEAFDIF